MYKQAVILSLKNLLANKARSALTILGMVIGITAVVVIFSTGDALRAQLNSYIDSFGPNTLQVEVKTPATSKSSFSNVSSMAMGATITTLKLSDLDAILKIPNVKDAYGMLMSQEQITYKNENKRSFVLAMGASAQRIDQTKISAGRFYTDDEDRGLARVAVLGPELSKKLFGDDSPLEKYIKIRRVNFRVVGVLESRGASMVISLDDAVYIPVRTAQKLVLGVDHIISSVVQVSDGNLIDQTVADIGQLMRARHQTLTPDKEDFSVTSMKEARATMDTVFGYLTFLLVALAGISLLVGGVGIMNVMFVSVRERTYEIGLRKALGATNRVILWQFLIETTIVVLVAGCVGILLGLGISLSISLVAGSLGYSWPFVLPFGAMGVGISFSILFGFIFGILPARQAAKLNPIEALRFE
ncbi:MAG: ABC transporter permease [bacterium]|nr:ABC transporter permease [bacterium]